jgi:hypothetical protein
MRVGRGSGTWTPPICGTQGAPGCDIVRRQHQMSGPPRVPSAASRPCHRKFALAKHARADANPAVAGQRHWPPFDSCHSRPGIPHGSIRCLDFSECRRRHPVAATVNSHWQNTPAPAQTRQTQGKDIGPLPTVAVLAPEPPMAVYSEVKTPETSETRETKDCGKWFI